MYHILERSVSETGRLGRWRDSGATPIANYHSACEHAEAMRGQFRKLRYEYRVVHTSRLNREGDPIERFIRDYANYPREIAL